MKTELIHLAFEKAEVLSGKESVNGRAEFLADYILENFKYSISAKSLIRYYKQESTPNREVENYLAGFLDYENYEAFVIANSEEVCSGQKPAKRKGSKPKKKVLISLLLIPVVGISSYLGFQQGGEKCMRWNEDHYIEVMCSGEKIEKKLNPVILKEFRKLKVSDTTTFFKHGAPAVWYDKSNKQLEYFNSPGIHPENGKTLKPITKYMIDKYVKE